MSCWTTRKLRSLQLRTLVVCTIAMMIDGYDLYVVGWILPALSDSFHVSRVALTPVLLIQQIGMLLSVYFVAPQADRFGRRNLLHCLPHGHGPVLSGLRFRRQPAAVHDLARADGPVRLRRGSEPGHLGSEIAPRRYRATFSTITVCGAQGGTLIGAAMQAFILPRYGWTGAMFLGCGLSAFILPFVIPWLPESPGFMVRRNSADPRLPRLVARVGSNDRPTTPVYAAASTQVGRGRVRRCWGRGAGSRRCCCGSLSSRASPSSVNGLHWSTDGIQGRAPYGLEVGGQR